MRHLILKSAFRAAVGLALVSAAGDGVARPINVLVVTIDTLRADRLGAYGWRSAQTPTIDRLAAEGLVVENAFTSAPVTLPAHATLMTGRLPPQHGVRGNSFYSLPSGERTLAEMLRDCGYRTGAVVGAAVLDHRFGLEQGFDLYSDETTSPAGSVLIAERDAASVTSRALGWLGGLDGASPFFLWVHLFDPHDPYEPPEPFRSAFADAPYDGEIAFVDREIGRLLDWLDRRGASARTLVVLTSDHGESLGEHGESTHGIFLYDATLRVPLIFTGPGVPQRVLRADDPIGLVDVLPTVLGRLGLVPPSGLAGRDLFAARAPRREFLYAESYLPRDFYNWSELRALRSAREKFVQAPTVELYNLVADPRELANVAGERPQDVRRLRAELAAVDQVMAGARESPFTMPPDLADRLRSLGYVTAGAPARLAPSNAERPDPKMRIGVVARLDEALALARTGRHDAAVAALRAALAADPSNHLAARMLADALFELARDNEAIAAYRLALATGRDHAYFHYRLALLYERGGRYRWAADEFAGVYRLDPSAAAEILERSDRLVASGNAAGGIAYLEALGAAGFTGDSLALRRANALLRTGRIADALAALDAAARRAPEDPRVRAARVRALAALGTARGERGDLAGAGNAFTQALALDPADFDSLANLGLTELRRGNADAALAALLRALALRPAEVRLLNLAAELRYRRAEYGPARELLERSLALDPAQRRITRALRSVERQLAARRP